MTNQGMQTKAIFEGVIKLSDNLKNIIVETIDLNAVKSSRQVMDDYELSVIDLFTGAISVFENKSGWTVFNSDVIPGGNTLSFTRNDDGTYNREGVYDVIADWYAGDEWWQAP